MKKLLLSLFVAVISISIASAKEYSGRVFVDKNNNGKFDKGEKVLKNISVSDGLNVVKSDKDGHFALPGHDKERFIFITTPSGYQTSNAHYQKIESGKDQYDFAVYPTSKAISKKGDHSFIQITDTEIFNTENHEDWISNIRNYANNEDVNFVMHTGDICYDNGLRAHIKLMNTENMGVPMFYAIGNHDLVKGDYGEQLFESLYGPVFYSFDVGNTHYVVTPMLSGDYLPSYKKEDVYKWLKNDLAHVSKDTPVIVFSHDLLTYGNEFKYGISDTEFVDLDQHNLKAWIYGHWHINLIKKQGSVYSIGTSTPDKGGIDHSTANFRVIDVDNKGNINSHLQYPYINKSIQIASIIDNKAPQSESNIIPLSVNTYDSNSKTKEVTYTLYADNKQIAKGRLAQNTDWNWGADVKIASTHIGKYIKVTVNATFNNGQSITANDSFVFTNNITTINDKLNDWTNLLGNAEHNGITNSIIDSTLALAWTTNIGANILMTSPIIYEGNIYTASVDENLKGEAHIYALSGKDGQLLWKYKAKNSIKNSISADKGIIFAQDVEGNLYAVNAQTGELSWETKLNQRFLPALIEGLTTANGILYAGTGKGLSAFNAENGNVIWTNEDWNQGEGSTNTIAVGSDVLVNGAQWGSLYANDATTGKMLWSNSSNGLSDRGASAAIHNNLIYITSRKSLFIIEATTGKVIVRKELPMSVDATSTPLLTDKEIVFGTSEAGLVALDNETLEIKWQFTTNESLVYTAPYTRAPFATIETSPILSENTVYFGASDGILYGVDIKNGKKVFEFNVGAPILNTPAVSDNNIFISDFGGSIYGLSGEKN